MMSVVPIIIPRYGIYLSPVFVFLFVVPLFVSSLIFCLQYIISFIIYLIRRLKK